MQYREIVAVTGLGGLYQLLSTKSDGAIVRSLGDNSTKFISSRQHNVTPLDSIEIYTTGANVRLQEVLQKMKDSDTTRPDAKANNADIRGYFRSVYPEMDEDRVYTSDMKKMLKWFEILKGADLLEFPAVDETAASDGSEDTETSAEGDAQVAEHDKKGGDTVNLVEDTEEKPAKKARAKKAATSGEEGEEKPAKKTAAKKKAEEGESEKGPKKTTKTKKGEAE